MKYTTVQKAVLALIIANMIWGAASPIFKLSLQNIPPFTLAFWRFFAGAILLLLLLRSKVSLSLTCRKDFFLLVGLAFFSTTINILFFFLGLQLTYAINAPVIASAAPILTLAFAMVLLKEPFRWKKFLGMLLGSAGILIIILEPLTKTGVDGSVLGNLFLIIATLGAVISHIIGRELFPKYSPITLTFWTFVIGAASFLPLAFWEYINHPTLYQVLDGRGWLGLGYGALFSSAIAYSLFAWGLSKISATDTAMFTYIDPIAGSILAVLLLHEPITGLFLLGSFFIFTGILIAEGRLHYHPFHKLRSEKQKTIADETISNKSLSRSAVIKHIFQKLK